MKALAGKRNKDEGILTTVAESIGSTMGTIVGRANAAQKALSQTSGPRHVKRENKKLGGKTKKTGRTAKN